MAGWSMRAADGSSLDCTKSLEKLEPLFLKSDPNKLRFWFNKFLGLFLKEICAQGCVWPFPPLLADGKPVDLFKLFLIVRENGGYNVVSESGLWDSIAKESGLGLNVASSAKLVYVKYLVSLERWLERTVQSEDSKSESNCSVRLMELRAELKGFLLESKKKVMEFSQVDGGENCVKGEESIRIELTNRVLHYDEVENLRNDHDLKSVVFDSSDKKFIIVDDYEDMAKTAVNSMCNDDEDCVEYKKCADSDDDHNVMTLDSNDIKEKNSCHKRKRDSKWEMLNWITGVAKDPCHLATGSLPESSKWKAYGSEELWKQVLLFRKSAFRRTDNHSSDGQPNVQKNQKMHPYMYDDNCKLGYKLRERLSCRRKVFSEKTASKGEDRSRSRSKSRSRSSSLGNHSDSDGSMVGIDKQPRGICDSITPGSVFDYDADVQVPIGPLFQAEVPEWTGVVSESNPKWLGTRVWPLEKTEKRSLIELDRIGKGRPDSCGCHLQDSVQCVKFHIGERRSKVKLELRSAFNKWKFDKMGEEDVASAWTEEERKTFSSIVKSNPPSLEKSFWDDIYKRFPKKTREELVCYYYNVFLFNRRAHQNRTAPSNINSDDDEPETEPAGKGCRREAFKPYTSILILPKKSSHKRARYSS